MLISIKYSVELKYTPTPSLELISPLSMPRLCCVWTGQGARAPRHGSIILIVLLTNTLPELSYTKVEHRSSTDHSGETDQEKETSSCCFHNSSFIHVAPMVWPLNIQSRHQCSKHGLAIFQILQNSFTLSDLSTSFLSRSNNAFHTHCCEAWIGLKL